MKYLKKTTALLLTVLLLFSAMVTGFTVSAEANTATITAAAVEVEASGTVNVPVKVTTTGLAAAVLTITVDDALTIDEDSIVNGEQFAIQASDVYNNVITVAVTAAGDANVVGTDIALISFDVTAPAEAAEAMPITVAATDTSDWAEAAVTVSTVDGSVTIKAAEAECTHEWEYVTATPAEGTSAGSGIANQTTTTSGSISLKCSLCEEEVTKEVQYYGRTKCFTANAVYQSAIQLEFSARKDRLIEAGQYTDAFIRFAHILSDGSLKETSQNISEAADTVKNSRDSKTWSYSVKAMQLTEIITTNIFVEIDGVWYSGESYDSSVRSYADSILPLSSVDDTERALVVNMLRYGSRMQTYKDYNSDNLADANLPAEYAALIIETDPTIEGAPSKDETIGNDCVQILSSFQLFMDSRTEVKFRVRSDRYTAEPAKDDFIIVASWDSARGDKRSASFYNEAYASEDDLTYGQDSQSSNAGRWEFRFGECSAYDFRQDITFNIYDPDDMNTDISQKYVASFESLLASGIAQNLYGDNELAMYKAMMNYSDAAKAHFCK